MERGRRPGFLVTQRDLDWLDEAAAWQWEMPEKATPFWRTWGIRHVRSFLVLLRAHVFVHPTRPDWHALWRMEWISYAIRRGWC
jgi:hypothetical protein